MYFIPSTIMKSCVVSLHPTGMCELSLCPYILPTGEWHSSHLHYLIDCHGIPMLVFKKLLFYFIIVPRYKSCDVGNLNKPKRSHKKC